MKKSRIYSKRTISIFLAAAIFLLTLFLSGCGGDDSDYPVTVGQIKLSSAPKSVVALNANAADVILNLGYASALTAKSDSCVQSAIEIIPSVGSSSSPDVNAIISYGADAVFADETLDVSSYERLVSAGINVFRFDMPKTETEIESFYRTVGIIMGGRTNGAFKADEEYANFYTQLSSSAAQVLGANSVYTVCYLYLDESGNLMVLEKDSFADKIIGFTGSSNLAGDKLGDNITVEQLLINYNPAFIFYDSVDVLEKLKSGAQTRELYAVIRNQCFELPLSQLNLMGISASQNVSEIMEIMYPKNGEISSNPGVTASDPTDPPDTEPSESETSSESEGSEDLSAQYGITLSEGMLIDENSDSSLITAVQERLKDLGYYTGTADGTLGMFTKQAVTDFQFVNNFIVDGILDYPLLKELFSSGALPLE